jgi:hypothetical protein
MKLWIRIAFVFMGISSVVFPAYVLAQRKNRTIERPDFSLMAREWSAYFPLKAGNEWIYSNGTSSYTVKVLRETQEANGLKYFEVSGYFGPAVHKLRHGPFGEILEYNPNGPDYAWYHFDPFEDSWRFVTTTEISCVTDSLVTPSDTRETVTVPAGSFENTLSFAYRCDCYDAGLLTENFASGVGLVQRVGETIAGPVTYKLVYAQVDGAEFPAAFYGIQVSMDRPVYYNNLMPPVANPWPTAQVLLTVRNTTEIPVQVTFPTSQRFDFVVRDALGAEILRWSDGHAFLQSVGQETLVSGSWRFPAEIKLRSRDSKVLPAGSYTLTGFLTSQSSGSGSSGQSATISFEIQDVH